ncbi:MAG TPA: hypothetical protein VF962_04860 [Gemmatimonadaceae bacterium]
MTLWAIRSTGLPSSGFMVFVSIDPRNSSTLYTGGNGVFKSTDGGASWTQANGGITIANVSGVAIDPFDSNHLLTSSTTPTYESKDGGSSWTPLSSAQGGVLVFDPVIAGRIYDSTFNDVNVSADGGKTWASLKNGLPRTHGNILAVARDGATLYSGGSTGGVWTYSFGRRRAVVH